jgi:hypothetical protein
VFERFTESARMVVVYAQEEARALGPAHRDEPEAILAAAATTERIRVAAMRRLASSPAPAAAVRDRLGP